MPQRNEAARCEEMQRAIDAFCEETKWSCREWKEQPHIAALFALRSTDDAKQPETWQTILARK